MGSVRVQSILPAGHQSIFGHGAAAPENQFEASDADTVRSYRVIYALSHYPAASLSTLPPIFSQRLAQVLEETCALLRISLAQCWVRSAGLGVHGSALVTSKSLPGFLADPFLEARRPRPGGSRAVLGPVTII